MLGCTDAASEMANAGLRSPAELQEVLAKAQEATKRYQAFMPETPHVRWVAEAVEEGGENHARTEAVPILRRRGCT